MERTDDPVGEDLIFLDDIVHQLLGVVAQDQELPLLVAGEPGQPRFGLGSVMSKRGRVQEGRDGAYTAFTALSDGLDAVENDCFSVSFRGRRDGEGEGADTHRRAVG